MSTPRFYPLIPILIFLAPNAFACGCVRAGNACDNMSGGIAFLGRVVVDSGEGLGERPAQLVIEEVLRGLPKDLKTISVNSEYGNSCHFRLKLGERYVVFGDRSFGDESGPTMVSTGACTKSFNLRGNEHVLDALRNTLSNGEPRLLGRVYRASPGVYPENGLPGVVVTLDRDGVTRTVTTDVLGNYEFRTLEPGRYRIGVERSGFLPDDQYNLRWSGEMRLDRIPGDSPRGTVLIPSLGCEIWSLRMWHNGRISGTIRDIEGQPVRAVRVQVFGIDTRNEVESLPLHDVLTDNAGHYQIDRIPPGEYVIGINAKKYRDEEAYPPTVFPRGWNREEAQRLRIEESGEVNGIDLRLLPKREEFPILVRVVDSAGKPMRRKRVFLQSDDGVERSISKDTDVQGEVVIIGYRGEEYTVMTRYSFRRRQFGEISAPVRTKAGEPTILTIPAGAD
jgi:Carboxypeptidase regulatory-like domain